MKTPAHDQIYKNKIHASKFMSSLLKISILLPLCLSLSVPASAATYSGGSGTLADPYQLSTDSDIDNLSATPADWSSNFTLTQDITLVGNHTPIGNPDIHFTGDFDGSGFAIQNLTVYEAIYYAGFFSYTGSDANIHDIGVEISPDGVTGIRVVGGLVGSNIGSTVSNSYATGSATGSSDFVGGLVGRNTFGTVSNSYANGSASGSVDYVGGLVGQNTGTVTNGYYSGSPVDSDGTYTSFINFTSFAFVSRSSDLYWNESGNIITTADDSGFVWKMVEGYTLPYFQYQDMPTPIPYVESLSVNSGLNYSAGSTSFLLNVTGCSFNITDTVFVNLAMAGQTPINGTINSITYTTINTTFNLTQAIAGDWSLYVINPDGQTSIAKNFIVQSLFIPGTPESFTNTTGNFWVSHSWSAGTGDVSDSYNVSYNGNWQNGTINSFNHTGLSAHAWSNITVYAYNATDSTISLGASDNVQVSNNAVSILNVTDITVSEGENVTFDINFTDADSDTPVFGCNNSALFDTFNTSTGEGLWITGLSDAGTYYVEFNVSDGYGSVDSQVMNITINDVIIPVADINANTTMGPYPLSVQFTDNSSNIPTAWFWDFGDGTNSTLQNPPAHTYNVAGIYNVSLNASNLAGSDLSSNMTITVTRPGTPESFTNTTGNFWVNHSWSAGTGDVSDSYNVSYDETWLNGTTDSFNHTGLSAHAWSNITVYAYNATDSTISLGASDNVQVSNNDVSILNVTDITVYEGENVTFNINSTDADGDTPVFGCNNSALFDTFNTSTGEGSWVTDLSDAGTYYVEFNVSDGYGSVDSHVMNITINDVIIPVADINANTTMGPYPLSVQFTDNSSNIPTGWFWDFGDGTNSTLQNPATHTYNVAGIYNVSLNASNLAGSDLSSNMTITVTRPGTPESFTNTTGNFWVSHSWNAGTGDVSDSYNVSYNGTWLNGTTNSFNHTGLSAHAWSNITVYAYNATDSTLSAGASDNVQVSNNAVSILNVTDITIYEGENVTFNINSTDADGDIQVFGCNNSALFDTFNTSTGEGSWSTGLTDAGTYYVEFNVSDGYDSIDSQVMTITINDVIIPVANFSANVTSGAVPLSVNFTDSSTNTPTSWLWDFGDGSNSTDQNPAHTYVAAGTYNVSLNASNFAGSNVSTQLSYITAAVIPVANFSANVTSGAVPLSVNFTDSSTNTPTSWLWNFGDGSNSTDQNPAHTYVAAGTYNVSLNASNVGGSNVSTQLSYITAFVEPVANFSANTVTGYAPLAVSFTDNSSNIPTAWFWDFGDDTNSTQQNPTHTYSVTGIYNVSLNASNLAGSNLSSNMTITVTTAPSTDSSRSSSSGSRASVSQGQNQEIVSNSASSVIRVTGGSEVYYDFSDSGIPVIGVSFDAKDDEGLVVARVQVLSDVSEGVPAPSSNCYQVMSIDVGNEGTISSDNAENIRIHFKVSRQWIGENNIDVSTIRMTRYHNEHWNDLPTYQESEDDEYIYFYAETPGFSIFEVVGDQLGTPIETSQVPAGSPVPVEEEEMPVEEESGFGFIYLILGIAAITGIGYVLIQKQKGEGGL